MTLLQVSALTADRVIALSLGHRAAFHWTGALTITIFHNPACSTSRKVLDMQLSPRESLRIQEPAYTDLRLDDDLLSNARIVELMVPNPMLMNRLIVRTPHGIKLCRPAEEVAPLLQPI